MRRVLSIYVMFLLLTAAALCGEVPPYPGPRGTDLRGENVYTVVKGDTLWEICARKLDNPWLWVKIWERNPHITDPNWIYPGDKIELETGGRAKPSFVKPENREKYADEDYSLREFIFKEEAQAEVATETGDSTGTIIPPKSNREEMNIKNLTLYGGFILEQGVDPLARIMSLDKEGDFASYGDSIYINKGSRDDIKNGDQFIVYETGEKVKHPLKFKTLGKIVRPLGIITVTRVDKNLSKCEITEQKDRIKVGDFVDYEYPRIVLSRKNIKPDYRGNIVYFKDGASLAGKNSIVHVDRGMKQGIKAGMFFDIYGDAKEVKDPDGGIKTLPPEIKGRIQVINSRKNVSMGIIISTNGKDDVRLGDVVEAE